MCSEQKFIFSLRNEIPKYSRVLELFLYLNKSSADECDPSCGEISETKRKQKQRQIIRSSTSSNG